MKAGHFSTKIPGQLSAEINIDAFGQMAMRSFLELHLGAPAPKSKRHGRSLSVVPGVVHSEATNAFATRYGGYHVIGLTAGLEKAILETSSRAFSKPYVFRDGDQRSATSATYFERFILASDEDPAAHDVDINLEEVGNPDRQMAVTYVAVVMYSFALLHELAHCLKGHVDFLIDDSDGEIDELSELNMTSRDADGMSGLTAGEQRILEFDADYWAMCACLRIERMEYDRIFSDRFDSLRRFQLSMFAIFSMTWLLANLERKGRQSTLPTHPDAVRRLSVLYTGSAAIVGSGREGPEMTFANHYAISQLKAIESRLREGWMEHGGGEHFKREDHRSVAQKLEGYGYVF